MKLKQFMLLLVIGVLLLSGCHINWDDEAALAEKVENGNSEQSVGNENRDESVNQTPANEEREPSENQPGSKEEDASQENQPDSKEEDASQENQPDSKEDVPQENPTPSNQPDEEPSDDFQSVPLGEGWEIKGVSLYKDTVYYYGYISGYEGQIYRMKLGKNQKPEYMGTGSLYGLYGSILLGAKDGKYRLMDLSSEKPEWVDLSLELRGKPQIYYKDQLWIFDKKEGQPIALVMDLNKKSGKLVETAVYPQDAVLGGNQLYYMQKSGEKRALYQADLPSKKVKELYTLSGKQEWQYAGGKILIYEENKNPIVLDLKTMKQSVPRDFMPNFVEIGAHIRYENMGDGTIAVEYYNKDKKGIAYWSYDIAADKGKEMDGFHTDRRSFGGGYYLYSESGGQTQFFYQNGTKYEFEAKSLRDHKVDAVNEYGAAAGGKGYIYTLRWSEGNAYRAVSTEDHIVLTK